MEEGASFGYWIRRQRKARDLTQMELATQVGVSVAMIRRLEADERRPSKEVAVRLAQILAIPVEDRATFLKVARAELAADHLPLASTPVVAVQSPPLPTPPRRQHLPAQATSLIGRDHEIAAIASLLRKENMRLLTLTGPGGTGKTRLALAVAAELQDEFADGVWFIDLAPVREPAFVAPTIAATLEVREVGAQPVVTALQAYLQQKQILLLLDNFEQVLAAAPLLAGLLKGAPHLKLLVTSRAVLHLYGEHEYPVPTLVLPDLAALPSTADLAQKAAVALFVERAQAVRPDFRLTDANAPAVAAICVRLDGLPLAIELAAARVKLLSPAALLSQLDQRLKTLIGGPRDLPPRQQTLRNAIAWSYQLLDGDEQMLFRRLAVFAGGWTIEGATAVCNTAGDLQIDVVDGLSALLDKSLVRLVDQTPSPPPHPRGSLPPSPDDEPRFTMLETIREYGLDQLRASGEEHALRHQHALRYLALAEAAEAALIGAQQTAWLVRLAAEHDNIRAALRWALDNGAAELAARLSGALGEFWSTRGHWSEGLRWLEATLDQSNALPVAVRAKMLAQAGTLALDLIDLPRAERLLQESLELNRAERNHQLVLLSLGGLGWVALNQGQFTRATTVFEEALVVARALGDPSQVALSLNYLAQAAMDQGDFVRAVPFLTEGLALFRELEDSGGIAWSVMRLGGAALFYQGDVAQAEGMFKEALALFEGLGAKQSIGVAHWALGWAALHQGDHVRAQSLLVSGLALFQELVDPRNTAYCLEGLAALAAALGQAARAVQLFSAAAALRDASGAHLAPIDRSRYEPYLAQARAKLNEGAGATAWAEGRAMTLEQAVAYALEESR